MVEIIIHYKELEKDGGHEYQIRYLTNPDSDNTAEQIASKLWAKEFGDSDLYIYKVEVI